MCAVPLWGCFHCYVDDGILLEPDDCKLTKIFKEISKTGLEIDDKGHPADYVGVIFTKHNTGYIKLTHNALIDTINNNIDMNDTYITPVTANS